MTILTAKAAWAVSTGLLLTGVVHPGPARPLRSKRPSSAPRSVQRSKGSSRSNQNDSGAPIRVAGSPDRYSATSITVNQLILRAYRVRDFQVAGGPDWMKSDRFDVEAKAETGSDPKSRAFDLMLQSLLADRFQLVAHFEKRDLPAFELTIAKNGLKIHASAPPAPGEAPAGVNRDPNGMPRPGQLRMGNSDLVAPSDAAGKHS